MKKSLMKAAVLAAVVMLALAACANDTTEDSSSGPGAPTVIRLYLDRPDTMNLKEGDFIQLRAGEELYIGHPDQIAQGKDVTYPYMDERKTTYDTNSIKQFTEVWASFFDPASPDFPFESSTSQGSDAYNKAGTPAVLSKNDMQYIVEGMSGIGWKVDGTAVSNPITGPLDGYELPVASTFAAGTYAARHDYDNGFVFEDSIAQVTDKNSLKPITDITDRQKPIAIRPNRYATGEDTASYIQMKNAKKKYLFSGEIKLVSSVPGSGGGTPIVVSNGKQPGYYIDFELVNKTPGSKDYDTVFNSSGSFYLELMVGAPSTTSP
jgi:hypothetical protein